MKINDRSLPYPVLGNRDDVFPLLEDKCVFVEDPIISANTIQFKVHLKQKNNEIDSFISNGKAEYVCELNCVRTFFRRSFKQSSPDFAIEVPRKSLSGKIFIDSFVTVKLPIEHYHNSQFNSDYEGVSFDMERGDVLVAFPRAYYSIDIKYDKLFAAGSFMQIANSNDDNSPTWFDYSGDTILIMVPPKMFKLYNERIKADLDYAVIIHSSMVLNALIIGLYNIDDSEYSDKKWAETIKYRINTEPALSGFDLTEKSQYLKLAQALLEDPYQRLFDRLTDIKKRMED